MVNSRIRLVSFDYDDTLVRTRECKTRAVEELGRRFYDKALTPQEIEAAWGEPYHRFFAMLLGDRDHDIGRIVQRYHSLNREFPVAAYGDAAGVAGALAGTHLIGIVSACGREQLIGQLEENELSSVAWSFIIAAEDAQFHKPDPRVFASLEPLMSSRGIAAGEVLHVGDSVRDLLAARGAGFEFVGIRRSSKDAAAMEAHGGTVVSSLTDALNLVRSAAGRHERH
jgi:phosphoglycolate phosphatase-like HAD superfamily hydrolase